MMHRTFLIAMAALCAVAFAAEEHPDWSALSGEVTIAAGVTNLAEEADMQYVNALTKITFGSATSAIRFTGATPPAIPFSGSGAIIKDSDYSWILDGLQGLTGMEDTSVLQCALVVKGLVTVRHSHQSAPYPFGEYDEHGLTLAGPITVNGAASTLKLTVTNAPNCQLTVSGAIGGEGNVAVVGVSRVYLANPTNTFAGSLTVNGAVGASLRLAAPGSAPNYAAVTSTTARIALDVKSDGSAWTPAKIVEFANAVTLKSNAFISLDASKSEDAAYTLSGDDWAQVADSVRYLSSDGTGTVTVTTSSLGDRRYAFGAVDGTLRFTGTSPLLVTNLFAAGSTDVHSQEVGTLVFDGAKSVDTTNSFITLGNQRWKTSYVYKPGYMVVTNSFITGTRASSYSEATSQGGIYPGWCGVGLLTIEPDSVVSSKFMLAYGNASSRGSVFQRGGDVAMFGARISDDRGRASVIGRTGYGYYELSGGKLDFFGRPSIATDSGQGILAIHGGTATLRTHYAGTIDPWLVLADKGNGHIYMKGGKLSITNSTERIILLLATHHRMSPRLRSTVPMRTILAHRLAMLGMRRTGSSTSISMLD